MINVTQLKNSLTPNDIISILSSLGAECRKESDTELIFDSICHHREDAPNHKPKLYYYIDTNLLLCYSCSWQGDIIALVQHIKDCNFVDALNFICDILHIDSEVYEKRQLTAYNWQKDLKRYIKRHTDYDDLRVYDENILSFFDKKYHDSWISFGLSVKTLEAFDIRWYERTQSIIIPVYDNHRNLVGIRSRNILPDSEVKYIPTSLLDGTTYKFPTNMIMYGSWMNEDAIRRQRVCYLAEAEKSVLRLAEWLGVDNNPSLAMFGSTLSKYNRDYIVSLGVNEVILVADRDFEEYDTEEYYQWEEKMCALADKFKGFCKVSIMYDKDLKLGYKDNVCDGSKEYFDEMYERREFFE